MKKRLFKKESTFLWFLIGLTFFNLNSTRGQEIELFKDLNTTPFLLKITQFEVLSDSTDLVICNNLRQPNDSLRLYLIKYGQIDTVFSFNASKLVAYPSNGEVLIVEENKSVSTRIIFFFT